MKLCFQFEDVKLEQNSKKLFTVTYGLQVNKNLSYNAACQELGTCLMHQAACNNLLDNSGE